MANNFEYKIHISIDEKGLKDSVKNELANMAKEFKNNAYKLEFTGDYKHLIQQLYDLQKRLPNIDITKGIEFHLADDIKEDSELGKKLITNLSTYVINSVKDMVTSIDSIKEAITETENSLDRLKKRRENLYDNGKITTATQAYERAEQRFIDASSRLEKAGQYKTRVQAIQDMKEAYQDMVNLQKEAGKDSKQSRTLNNINLMIEQVDKEYEIAKNKTVKLSELRDQLLDTKVTKNSFSEMIGEIDSRILEEENRLSELKRNLETAQNPELQVKGKLANNFIEDLQSQLDQITGLKVKVEPKIDKDAKLEVEVEGDVKPTVQSDKKIELPKPAEEIDLGRYDLSKIEVINEKLSEYKSEAESISESAQKAVDELNKFTGKSYTLDRNMYDIPSTLRAWNEAGMSANDFKKEIKAAIEANEKEKAAILYENLKTFYPKTTATLDTFKDKDFKDNYNSYLSRGKTKVQALQLDPDLQRYRVLEDAIHQLEIKQGGLVRETAEANAELEKQAKISSELSKYDTSTKNSRNSAIQSLNQQIAQKEAEMANMLKLDKDFQDDYHKLAKSHTNHESTEEYGQLLEKYNIPKGSGFLQSVKYLANQRGELQETIDILKGVRQAISESNEAISTSPNTSGINKVEEELYEEAQAANKAAEAERNVSEAREKSTKTVYRAYNRTAGIMGEEGMTWFSDDPETMKTYVAQNPDRNVVKGQIDTSKFFKLDAQGAKAAAITYLGDQSDEVSKKITEVYNKIQVLKKELAEKPSDALSEELKQLELEYDKLSEDESNMYGTRSSTQFALRAKEAGYKGIEISNVIDDYNMKSGKTSTTIALFDNEALRETEDITSQIKGNIETTQQAFDRQSAINSHADFLLSREDIDETETDIDILTNKLEELNEENRLVSESAETLGEKLREITTATSEGNADIQNIKDYYSPEIGDIFDKDTDIGKYYDYLVQNTDFGTTEEEVSTAYEQIAQKILDFQKEVTNIVRSKIEAIIGDSNQEGIASDTTTLSTIDEITQAEQREAEQARITAEEERKLNEAREQGYKYSSTNNPYKALKKGGLGLQYLNDDEWNPDESQEYEDNVVRIIESNEKFAADADITCEKASTAVRKFFDTIGKQIPELATWKDMILEAVDSGTYKQFDTDSGLWGWGLEKTDEGQWYMYVNQTKEAAEETVKLRYELAQLSSLKNKIFKDWGLSGTNFKNGIFPEDQEKYLAEEKRIIAEVKAETLNYYDAKDQLSDMLTKMSHNKYGVNRFIDDTRAITIPAELSDFKEGLITQIKNGSLEAVDAVQLLKDKVSELQTSNQTLVFHQEPPSQMSMFEQEAEGKRNDAKATTELAEAEKELKQERQQSVSESESATQGAASVKNEADELDNLILKAQQAANAKKEFVEANKQLMESVINSLKGLNLEGQGFEELNKLINNIGNNKDGRIDSIIEKLEKIKELFMSNVADDSFIHELDSISSHEQGLSDLLKILKDYKDNLSDVAKAENEVNESTISSSTDSSTIKILDNDTKKTIEDVQKLKDELKNTSDIYETIKIGKDKDGNSVTHTSYQHKNKDYTANVNEAGDVTSVTTKVSSGYTDQLNNIKKIQGAYSELIRLQRQLDSLARQKDSPARQQAVKDTNAQISATKKLIEELNKESYTDEQLLEIKKSRQKYELQLSQLRSKVASDNVSNREKKELQQSKEMYDQLKQAVKDYVAVKKQNAAKAGKDELLQEDIDKANKLQERIDSIKEKIKNNGLFNGKLEGKATSGLNGLDTTLTEIENSARDSKTLKQQKANVDELKRSYDRLYLLEKKLDELQKNPMTNENKDAIENVNKLIKNEETLIGKLQKETYTKEQQTQIDKIRENYNTKQKNDLAELATKETELAEATEKRKQAENGEALRNLYKQQESEMDSLIDKQKTVGESFMAEQEAYEQNFIKQKQGYEELKALVQSYVTVMKQNARNGAMGKLLQKDIDYANELEERIYGLTDKLAGDKSLFNADLESKALSGLTGLDTTLERISRTTNDTQYIKQQQKDANELIKLYDKLYNAEQKIRESELITDNPAKQDKIFRDNQILVESYQKRKAVLEETSYTERQLSDIETAKQDYYLKTTKAMLAVDMAKKRLNNTTTEEIQKDKEVELEEQKKSEALERTRLSLINQLNTLTRNGKLMRVYGTEVNKMISELQNTDVAENRLKSIRNRLTEIKVEANKTGNSGATLIQMISGRFKSLLAYLSTFASFYRVVSYVRQAFATIKDLDTQLVDLRKTTSMNTQELNNFYHASSDVAKQLGVTTSEIISQASAWSRLGYSTKEEATEMAKLSSQFASISPGMDTQAATDSLVSTMQAYKIGVDEVQRTVMDNINAIGNSMATTNQEIGEMLQRSSAAMKAANNTLEETIALESAAVEITRNAETTGTAFRTISMRIRGKQSLPPYSESYMLCA